MKSSQLLVILILSFAALSFYLVSAKKNQARSYSSLLKERPSFFSDSPYLYPANPYNEAKAELGRYLFYDRRLSFNKTKSCASCHDQKFSFTDGYRRSIGAAGDLLQRNSSPLINIVYKKYLTAADSSLHYPEQQINNPMFHNTPIELGWKGHEEEILDRIKNDQFYRSQFKEVFADADKSVTIKNIQYCIASFIKSIFSYNSRFDQFFYQKQDVLSASEKKGMQLFFSAKLNCSSCHGGTNFDKSILQDDNGKPLIYFNTGLYNIGGKGDYPESDKGLYQQTGNRSDMGRYRIPTLRNLAFTAPYYHDGSAVTLEEVISNYENGGRLTARGLLNGNGSANPYKSNLIKGFLLTGEEEKDLISFLLALSDSSVLVNKKYSNPFRYDETK
ncbi:MAG: di-heme enzyme [Bacteroidetes bacterium]|nr:di-heme enzyme [Bacteroidota bacterium]